MEDDNSFKPTIWIVDFDFLIEFSSFFFAISRERQTSALI